MKNPTRLLLAAMFTAVSMFAQFDSASVLGSVHDPSGSVIVNAKITLRIVSALTKPEFIQLLDSVLAMNGISMIPVGEKFVKAVPTTQALAEGAPFGQKKAEELPESGQYLKDAFADVSEDVRRRVLLENPIEFFGLDAGADLILGHHPHMLKGIEVYKGKVILYSIGNFAFDSHPKAVDTLWYGHRRKVYQGLLKVPEKDQRSAYHFQPESRYSIVAKIAVEEKKIRQVSVLPVFINSQAQPEPFSASDSKGQEVIQYLREITQEASLNAGFTIRGDEAVIT